MSIPRTKCAGLAAIIITLSFVIVAYARAQSYPGLDCNNPDFFQDCKYYSDVYGYPYPNYSYYSYGLPVGVGIGFGFFPRRPFFHHPLVFFDPRFHAVFRGTGALHR